MSEQKNKAFMNLYQPAHARFEKFCKARVYGEFDFKDLMQETILIAYQKFETINEPKAFLYFLFGIAIRILANNNRKQKTETLSMNSKMYQIPNNFNLTDQQIEINHLNTALAMLPEVQRESIILFEISGFSIKEIAELQNASESAVKQRLLRGRQELLSILEKKPMPITH